MLLLGRAQAATQQHREQWEPESHGGPSSFTLPLDMEHIGCDAMLQLPKHYVARAVFSFAHMQMFHLS